MKKQTKKKFGVGSVVKAKVGELEKISREGRSRRMRKYVVGCVQTIIGKKKFLIKFEDGHNIDMGSVSLFYGCTKGEICLEID